MINGRNTILLGKTKVITTCWNVITYLFLWKFIENQDPKKSSKSTSGSTVKGKKKGKEITCNQV